MKLNVSNQYGSFNNSIQKVNITVIPAPPIANFTADNQRGYYPLLVRFRNQSIGCQTAWNWSLGDGTFNNSANPIKTYSTWGNYTVSLNVSNRAGYNISTQPAYIVVLPLPPVASFTTNTTLGACTKGSSIQ